MLSPLFENDRPAPDVQSQPHVELRHWRILQRGNGTLYIAAQLASGSFRLTSTVVAIDLQAAVLWTASGRCYHLCEPPEQDEFLRNVMGAYAVRELLVVSADVSDIIWGVVSTGIWPAESMLLPPVQSAAIRGSRSPDRVQ